MKPFDPQKDTMTASLAKTVDQIIAAHNQDATQLVGILLDIQDAVELHYIPKPVAYYVAEALGLKVTQVYDVISFYASLYEEPRARFPIQICDSVVCRINDSDSLYSLLREVLNIDLGEVTYDYRFSLEKVPCFGACDKAPAIRVNGKVYGPLTTKESVVETLKTMI